MHVMHRPLNAALFPSAAMDRCPELLKRYRERFPCAKEGRIDFEDWAENTLMLFALDKAAQSLGHSITLLLPVPAAHHTGQVPLTPRASGTGERAVMWGMFYPIDSHQGIGFNIDLAWNDRASCDLVKRWPLTATFQKFAGRKVEILDMDFDAIRAAMHRLQAGGQTHGFLKTVEKGWTQVVDLDEDIPSDLAWDIVANEGLKSALILQEVIKPRCEYRLFVVGDQVVTGAGCIEAFTPLDRLPDQAFDPRVEIERNKTRPHEDPDLVARYVAFAEDFAGSWAAEVGEQTAYTLDLCLDAQSRTIVPIELNPITNTGLYAADPDLLARALLR